MTSLEHGSEDASAGSGAAADPLVPWIAPDEHAELRAARSQVPRRKHRRRRRRSPGSFKAQIGLVAAAAISGLATAGEATGLPAADRLLRGGLAAAVAAAAAAAPTWAVVLLSTGAAALGWSAGPLGATAGVAALVLMVVLAIRDDLDRHLLKAAAGALSATALLRVPGGRFGVTATATAVLAGLVVVSGVRSGPRRWRRPAVLAVVGLLGLGAVGAVLGAAAGLLARSSFERAAGDTGTALAAAGAGDAPAAAASARSAGADLRQARGALRAWWARPAWAVPVVGAHLRAGHDVASSAGPAVEAAASSAEVLRLEILRSEAGRLDLGRVAAAEPELARLNGSLRNAQRGATRARSPWLLAPLQARLDRYDTQLGSVTTTSNRALLAVRSLPRLLGAERPTRWFVAVGNPAESRDLGGCVCNYAILTADRGAIRLDRAGSVSEIGASRAGRTLDGVPLPGRYLSQRPDLYWQNLGGHPDLPTVAKAARALWDQEAPGSPIDGVAYVDPHGLAALLALTGPVTAPPPLGRLTAETAAQVLHEDQYTRFTVQDERRDALQDATRATFTALTTAPLPGPGAMGSALGPAVQGGHLLATTFDADGQRLFEEIGLAGRFAAPRDGDMASLRTSNLAANKLDAFLRRSVRYEVAVDKGTGRVQASATVELRNEATADLPDYVAANAKGLPKGTNVLAVAWYSGLPLDAVEVDGRTVAAKSDHEIAAWVHTVNLTLPPGSTTTVVFRLAGELRTSPYRLTVAPQASVRDDSYTVEVEGRPGWRADPVTPPVPGRRTEIVVPIRRS